MIKWMVFSLALSGSAWASEICVLRTDVGYQAPKSFGEAHVVVAECSTGRKLFSKERRYSVFHKAKTKAGYVTEDLQAAQDALEGADFVQVAKFFGELNYSSSSNPEYKTYRVYMRSKEALPTSTNYCFSYKHNYITRYITPNDQMAEYKVICGSNRTWNFSINSFSISDAATSAIPTLRKFMQSFEGGYQLMGQFNLYDDLDRKAKPELEGALFALEAER